MTGIDTSAPLTAEEMGAMRSYAQEHLYPVWCDLVVRIISELTAAQARAERAREEAIRECAEIARRCFSRGHEGFAGDYNRGINTGFTYARADIERDILALLATPSEQKEPRA